MSSRIAVFPPPPPAVPLEDMRQVASWVLAVFDQASQLLHHEAVRSDEILAHSERAARQLCERVAPGTDGAAAHWRQAQIYRLCGLAPAAVDWAIRHGGDWRCCQELRPHLQNRCERIIGEAPHGEPCDD